MKLTRVSLAIAATLGGMAGIVQAEDEIAPPWVTTLDDGLVAQAQKNPCALVVAALRSTRAGKETCAGLREKNGDLVVELILRDWKRELHLLQPGQRCPGGYREVDKRPARKPKWLSYVEIVFTGADENRLEFTGVLMTHELLPSGKFGASIGKGCGPEVVGIVRLSKEGWRLVGPREDGCSE